MNIYDLYHYKTGYKIYNFLKFKNHPNLIINYELFGACFGWCLANLVSISVNIFALFKHSKNI